MTTSSWHIAILVPARNEEMLLPRCLDSIASARAEAAGLMTTDLIVVTDDCTDNTHRIALQMVGLDGAVAQIDSGNVGNARAAAASIALQRYQGRLDRCWLANTDADCSVPRSWLITHLSLATAGYAGIAGIIDVDGFEEHAPHVAQRFRDTYRLCDDGTHSHVHGANFGVRADSFLDVGGWAPKQTAEDHDLWNRLRAAQLPVISDTGLKVLTSGRRVGRAPNGFAAALAMHNKVLA